MNTGWTDDPENPTNSLYLSLGRFPLPAETLRCFWACPNFVGLGRLQDYCSQLSYNLGHTHAYVLD